MTIYLDYTREELDRQYEHRHLVPDAGEIMARQKTRGERVRAAATGRFDVAYGDGEDEVLDIYLADCDGDAPVVVYFHGGRWSMGSKNSNCECAELYTAGGIHFVSVNFTLLPKVAMDDLVSQCRAAVAWIWRNAGDFGGDPDRIFIHGKSSGAHLAAMMAVTDWQADSGLPADLFKGGLLVSGMYDLEPVRLTFRNEVLRLDEPAADRNSPIRHIPANGCPLIVAVGALETEEFRRQSRAFSEAWRGRGLSCQFTEIEDRNHYTMNDEMAEADSPMVAPFQGWMQIADPVLNLNSASKDAPATRS